jgi:hypothetical protein
MTPKQPATSRWRPAQHLAALALATACLGVLGMTAAEPALAQGCNGFSYKHHPVRGIRADNILSCSQHRSIIRGWVDRHFSHRGVPGSYGGRARGLWFCSFYPEPQASCLAGKEGFINFRVS